MVSTAFLRQLEGFGLTTAEILYRMPDHRTMLQTYVWQDYDLAPKFPVLRRFLDFWEENLDGKLHSVQVASTALVTPGELSHKDHGFSLH